MTYQEVQEDTNGPKAPSLLSEEHKMKGDGNTLYGNHPGSSPTIPFSL